MRQRTVSDILNKFTIRIRLIAGFTILVLIALTLAGIGILALDTVADRTGKADDANRLVKQVLDLRGEEKNYLLQSRAEDADDVRELVGKIRAGIVATKEKFENAENDALMDELAEEITQYEQTFERYVQLDHNADAQQVGMETAARSLEGILDEYRAQQKKQVRRLLSQNSDPAEILEELREADAANRLIKHLLEARRDEKNFQIRSEPEAAEQVSNELDAASALAAELRAKAERESSRQVAVEVSEELEAYRQTFSQFVEDRSQQRDLRPVLVKAARQLESEAQALREDQKAELLKDTAFATTMIEVLAAVSVALAVLISWLMVRAVVAPLDQVTLAMQNIADGEGDLTRRLPSKGEHEIAKLASAFNAFAERMRTAIETVASNVAQLSAASEELSATAEQSKAATSDQRQQTESLATAMNEMTATTHEVSRSIERTNESTVTTSEHVESGESAVNRTVEQIHGLADRISQTANNVEDLAKRSGDITSVLDVIKGVADQTNLLALNAAIEAARAGEQGRGFAVVADEVRTLAGRTQTSAVEIGEIIESLQANVRQSVDGMRLCQNDIETATEASAEAGQALSEITQTVSTILDMSNQIASAAEQQNATIEEMNQNTQFIHDMSVQNATATEQTSATTRELAGMASNLQNMVAQFRV
ncbi:MAG: hypothetical protein CMF08_00090 [Idiomarina sp.]|nr:hypothetical protein [Idiomarina sp.]